MQEKTSPALIGCFGLIGVVVLIWVFSSGSTNKNTSPSLSSSGSSSLPTALPESGKDPKVCLELLNKSGSYDEYSTKITGTIKNNCGRTFSYVQITFKLFDGADNVVGTALANQNNLEAGETWKFSAHGFTVSKRYRLDEITAF
jgi:hypothetical protein